ncbi:MAG: hypothetical protein AABO57_16800 [Acidobacteriota bacterium]
MQISGQAKRKINHQTGGSSRTSSVAAVRLFRLVMAVCVFSVTAASSRAQLPEPPLPVDPRPLSQLLSPVDKAFLAQANNPKKLVDAYLKISDAHLQVAGNAIKANNHSAAELELDIYTKAAAAALKEAFAIREGKRDLAKKVEQTLYRQIKILETIYRLFPGEREVFAEAALKRAKQLRVQALNEAFASGDVLKDPDEEKKPKSEPPPKEAPAKNPPAPPLVFGVMTFRRNMNFQRAALADRKSPVMKLAAVDFKAGSAHGQTPVDYLTDEEDNHVREAQAADARVKVFMKIADRRLNAIVGPAPARTDKKDEKKVEEEEREWGAVPKVSRAELLRHYARAISECIAKLEDAYERNPKSSALPKALAFLRDSTDKHLQTLRTLKPELKSESEIAAMSGAIEEAETANKGARDGLK